MKTNLVLKPRIASRKITGKKEKNDNQNLDTENFPTDSQQTKRSIKREIPEGRGEAVWIEFLKLSVVFASRKIPDQRGICYNKTLV